MSFIEIRNQRLEREAREAAKLAPIWRGEAWRADRTAFAVWFREQCAREGVALGERKE